MQHPLVNPSLAPYKFAFPLQANRLDYQPVDRPFYVNPERHLAKAWAKIHRQEAPGPLPIEIIVHEIMPGMRTVNRLTKSDFSFAGKPYLSRDIALLSSIVYWFATNVGNAFLDIPSFTRPHDGKKVRTHLERFRDEMKRRDLVQMWTHVCTGECESTELPLSDSHEWRFSKPTTRDYELAKALMHWVDSRQAREFFATWHTKLSSLRQELEDRRKEDVRRKLQVA